MRKRAIHFIIMLLLAMTAGCTRQFPCCYPDRDAKLFSENYLTLSVITTAADEELLQEGDTIRLFAVYDTIIPHRNGDGYVPNEYMFYFNPRWSSAVYCHDKEALDSILANHRGDTILFQAIAHGMRNIEYFRQCHLIWSFDITDNGTISFKE